MKWISVRDRLPFEWDWVIAGYESYNPHTVWQICRYVQGEWDTWGYVENGPTAGDINWAFDTKLITHWSHVDDIPKIESK